MADQTAASTATAATRPARPTCQAAEHHQFDFWIGEWDVTSDGKPAGHNVIKPVENGCALSEQWTGAGGDTGVSYNAYDRTDKQWHQFWVSGGGMVLRLAGSLNDGNMVLKGDLPNPGDGSMSPQRITWTPNPDGSVRQHWESQSNGKWTTVFDGLYRRVGSAAAQ